MTQPWSIRRVRRGGLGHQCMSESWMDDGCFVLQRRSSRYCTQVVDSRSSAFSAQRLLPKMRQLYLARALWHRRFATASH